MARNVKHIIRGDPDIATVHIFDHISSVTFVGQSLRGPGLSREEAGPARKDLPITWTGRDSP